MRFTFFLLAPALAVTALAASAKAPTPYHYPYELHDTSKHDSSFFIFPGDTGKFTDGRSIQLKKMANGDYITVVDATSPVLQAQLKGGQLEQVKYHYLATKKKPTGFTAGLKTIEKYGNTTSYEIIFSTKEFKDELGHHGWTIFSPEGTDGVYSIGATTPFRETESFLFALCEKKGGEYYQLVFADATGQHEAKTPPGCYETQLFATVAPPYGKNPCKK